jgi:hypothetical protein
MIRIATVAVGLLALLLAPGKAEAVADPDAVAILAAAKAASGGDAWDHLPPGWRESGEIRLPSGKADYDTWLDLAKPGMTVRQVIDGKVQAHGFDGGTAWRLGADGALQTINPPADLSEDRQGAYFSAAGYFFPDRFPAETLYLGPATADGALYDIVLVTPAAAKPLELWIDHATHMIARFVDRNSPAPVTATVSDYRQVHGVAIPFHVVQSDGDPRHTLVGQVSEVDFGPLDPTIFQPHGADWKVATP